MGILGWVIMVLILVYWVIPKAIGYGLAEGYSGDYIPMSGAGYIPLYQLMQPTPDIPRCIDGDSVRPCWKDTGNGIITVR